MVTQLYPEVESPNAVYPVPGSTRFKDSLGHKLDFIEAPDLEHFAHQLIARYPSKFEHLDALKVVYLWKGKGGKVKGKLKVGQCQYPDGLLRHFADAHFIIWLAADNCHGFTNQEIRAALFHELLHAGYDLNKDQPTLYPHDVETFATEVEIFGCWRQELVEAAKAFRQLRLVENTED